MSALRRIGFVIAALAAAATPACSPDQNVLQLYTSLDVREATEYIDAFERETGTRVRWVRLSAGEALARIEAERNNPQVSVWFGGPSPEYIVAAQRGLLEPYEPALDHMLDSSARGVNWEWTGFYSGVLGFACNDAFFRDRDFSCPDSWQALLDPQLRSNISMAYPYTSGTAYITVVGLLALLGEEAGWRYIEQLDAQVHRYNSSGTAAVTQAGLGEVAVGIAFSHDILKKGIERGYPVTLSIPREGTAGETGAVAIIRGGRQQELARQFVTWLHTERAQNLLAEFYRVPLHPAARVADHAVMVRSTKLIEYDAVEAASNQQRILDRWRRVTGR